MKSPIGNLLILLLFFSCSKPTKREIKFKIPVIYQNGIKGKFILHKADSLGEVWPIFINKFKFDDSIKLIEGRFINVFRDTTDYINGSRRTTRKDVLDEYSYIREDDTFRTDGFQIFADYKTTLYYNDYDTFNGNCYYPVYIVNETYNTKIFMFKDREVFAIQESKDNSNKWRPIECEGFEWCGNGHRGLLIYPGEYVLFLLPKYEGSNSSAMRVRLRIGENIYISNTFKGSFNYNQFYMSKKLLLWRYKSLGENSINAMDYWFYGATPKGLAE